MEWNEKRLIDAIAAAATDDLLDRVTAYRAGMESEAIKRIERELHKRGVTAAQIADHREQCNQTCVFQSDGTAVMCSFCRKPAIKQGWGWHKLWGVLPLIPRWLRRCADHAK
jgi:hypothetical protein